MLCLSSVKGVRSGGELKGPENPLRTVKQKPYQGQTIHICCNVTAKPIVKMWESNTQQHSLIHGVKQIMLQPAVTALLYKTTELSHSYWVPQNHWPRTRPGSLCDAQCDAHDPAWNRKWAGKARKLVCGDGSFLRPSITAVLSDLLCSVTHLWSMCFQSTGLGFRWTTNRWPKLSHVRRPQSALSLQRRRVMFSSQPSDEW